MSLIWQTDEDYSGLFFFISDHVELSAITWKNWKIQSQRQLGHGKSEKVMEKVMESHGMSESQKRTNHVSIFPTYQLILG